MKITKTLSIEKDGDWIVANTPELDRDKDRIFPDKINVDNFEKNNALFWGHNYRDPWAMIGRVAEWQTDEKSFRFRPEFREPTSESDPMTIIKSLWDNNILRASSIGFIPKERTENEEGGYDFGEVELLEISLVPIPAHQDAIRMAVKGFVAEQLDEKDEGDTGAEPDPVDTEPEAQVESEPTKDEPSHDESDELTEAEAEAILEFIQTIGEIYNG